MAKKTKAIPEIIKQENKVTPKRTPLNPMVAKIQQIREAEKNREVESEQLRKKYYDSSFDSNYTYYKTLSDFQNTYNAKKNTYSQKEITQFLEDAKIKYRNALVYYVSYSQLMIKGLHIDEHAEQIVNFIERELEEIGQEKPITDIRENVLSFKVRYLLLEKFGMLENNKFSQLSNTRKGLFLSKIFGLDSISTPENIRQKLSGAKDYNTPENIEKLSKTIDEINNYTQPRGGKKK